MKYKPVPLIYNPAAGALRRGLEPISQIIAELERRGFAAVPCPTSAAGEATQLARDAVKEGREMIIVCGGDGTINEAAQALVGSETVLAIWPGGTANVLAKDLRLPRRPGDLADLIAAGRTMTISVGRAIKPETNWQRYFLLMAGIGLDAAIVKSVDVRLKRELGFGAYWAAGLNFLVRWPLTPFSITLNEKQYEATLAIVANAPGYGGWFKLAPRARLDDDKLDVCTFNTRSRIEYLTYAVLSLTGSHTLSPHVTYQETQVASANANHSALVQLDGDLAGPLPMRFECVPRALRVICPGPVANGRDSTRRLI